MYLIKRDHHTVQGEPVDSGWVQHHPSADAEVVFGMYKIRCIALIWTVSENRGECQQNFRTSPPKENCMNCVRSGGAKANESKRTSECLDGSKLWPLAENATKPWWSTTLPHNLRTRWMEGCRQMEAKQQSAINVKCERAENKHLFGAFNVPDQRQAAMTTGAANTVEFWSPCYKKY